MKKKTDPRTMLQMDSGDGTRDKILDLKENPGILPLKLGPAKIRTSTHDFIHYYNLTPIAQEIDAIQNQYEANFIQGLQYQLEAVHRKFQSIYPSLRGKRALINALGSIVKAISGNLDQDDAEKYDSAISTLQRNQYKNAPCRNINPGYLCHSNSIQYDTTSKECIAQILRLSDDAAFCQHVPVTINTTLIEQLTPGHYIAIFPEPTKISTHCFATGILVLHGTFLIELPTECGFETTRDAYINSKKVIREQPLTLPKIETVPVHPKEEIKPIQLEKIPLDELHKATISGPHAPYSTSRTQTTPIFGQPRYTSPLQRWASFVSKYYHYLPCQKKATTTPPSEPPVLFRPSQKLLQGMEKLQNDVTLSQQDATEDRRHPIPRAPSARDKLASRRRLSYNFNTSLTLFFDQIVSSIYFHC
ncbi:hypothetical protein JTB14_000196 [Gonioctena quinquepunctata]|nr:hypothetical protein JTB14_000196 [Gonioctena quinquepunctata]